MAKRGTAVVEVTSYEKDVQRGFRNVGKELDKLNKKLDDATGKGKKAGQAMSRVGSDAAKAGKHHREAFEPSILNRWASGLVGVGGILGAYRLITAEVTRIRELNKEIADAQITVNQARQDVLRNLGGATREEKQNVLSAGRTIAAGAGIKEVYVQAAMAQAISASGGNVPASIAAVQQAAQFIPDRPEEMPLFAGAFLDLAKVTGTNDARVNQGLLQMVGALSRVVSPTQQARNIPQAMVGLVGQGATVREAGALFAALSNAAADVEGNVTRTGLINFAEQINQFLPDVAPGEVGPNIPTLGEKIRRLRESPKMAREVAASLTARAAVKVPLRQLITEPDSVIATAAEQFAGQIPGRERLGGLAQQAVLDRYLDPLEATASLQRRLQTTTELMRTGDLASGYSGTLRAGLEDYQRATKRGYVESKYRELTSDFGDELYPGQALEELLQADIDTARAKTTRMTGFGAERVAPTKAALERANILEGILNELKMMRGDMKETRERGNPTLMSAPDEDK